MAYRARILEGANDELEEVVAYLSARGGDAAADFLDAFEAQLDLICSGAVEHGLSRMPELARLGYRAALVGRYLFLYYVDGDAVVVAHLFHQRQDYASLVMSRDGLA